VPPWKSGDLVTVRSARWRVLRSTRFSDCEALDLVSVHSPAARTLLLPFDRPRAAPARRPRIVSQRGWAHEVRRLVCESYPYGGLRFCPPGIRLLPYQLEPALAILRHGALRVLIADDVGLGKTVEAAIVVREVVMADRLARALIVCPASLRAQWAHELSSLFGLEVTDADNVWLRQASRELPGDVNPWSIPGVYLASMDFVKRSEALRPLEDVRWDLLVVDEAHAATPGSHRRAALNALACRARRVMLLTATPHSGDDEQFRALCHVGATRESLPIVVFSRTRGDTPLGPSTMRSSVLAVRPSEAERRMHTLLERYTARVWTESRHRDDSSGELLATVLRKRALSSAAALAISLRRRIDLLAASAHSPAQLALPFQEEDLLDLDETPDRLIGAAGLMDATEEHVTLAALAAAADTAANNETKIASLLRFLRRTRESAIVFSEYRDTAERLARHLSGHGHRVLVLHGGMNAPDRARTIAAFGAGTAVLVATDAASEGLNLQRGCRIVVHFELPWTPSRIRQRAGRVNRIGQDRRVHEIALVARHTSEQLVLVPLLRRAIRAQGITGFGLLQQFTESRVAAHVLAGAPVARAIAPPAPPSFVRRMPLQAEARDEVDRLAMFRRLTALAQASHQSRRANRPSVPFAQCARRRRPVDQILLVFSLSLHDEGDVLEETVLTVAREIRSRAGRSDAARLRGDLQRAIDDMRDELETVAAAAVRERLEKVGPLHVAAREALHARQHDLYGEVQSTAQRLVQAGLFDRRAMRAALVRARVGEILQDDQQARLWRSAGAAPVVRGSYELRAVLLRSTR
jgi:superfamily II DNA or RNA helicase